MFSLLYISRADQAFNDGELLALLENARRKNRQLEITGMLLYKDGNFMQLLEGEEPVVRDLYETISTDLRHRNVTVLAEETVPERRFAQWSMGFHNLKSVDVAEVPGYSKFLSVPLTSGEFAGNPSRGEELLLLFKKIG